MACLGGGCPPEEKQYHNYSAKAFTNNVKGWGLSLSDQRFAAKLQAERKARTLALIEKRRLRETEIQQRREELGPAEYIHSLVGFNTVNPQAQVEFNVLNLYTPVNTQSDADRAFTWAGKNGVLQGDTFDFEGKNYSYTFAKPGALSTLASLPLYTGQTTILARTNPNLNFLTLSTTNYSSSSAPKIKTGGLIMNYLTYIQ